MVRPVLIFGLSGVDVSTNPAGCRAGLSLDQPENKALTEHPRIHSRTIARSGETTQDAFARLVRVPPEPPMRPQTRPLLQGDGPEARSLLKPGELLTRLASITRLNCRRRHGTGT